MAATDPTAYGASWYAANMVDAPARGPLTLELDVDVCVVGGGLAGLTVALEVARRGWSVAVLEARRVAWNASGRNAGFVLPGFAVGAEELIQKVGPRHARALWSLSEAGVQYVRRTVRETNFSGVELQEGGWLHVSKSGHDRQYQAHAELLAREFGAAAEFWPAERVRTQLRSASYFGAVHMPSGFAINPLNYALGLAAAAEAAGARIFEETPALQIDPAGVRKRITTPLARVRAGHVVLAGNVHIGGLMPRLAGTLVPVSNYIAVTAPLGGKLRDVIGFRGVVSDTELVDNHYRVVGGDRLMWSGRLSIRQGKPRRYAKSLMADLARTYPQLGKVEAEYAWSGTLGVPVHRMPQVGEVSPGVWLLSGFAGHGLNTTAMGGEIIARAIVDGDQAWRLFLPFDLVWAGGAAARGGMQAFYRYHRTRERIQSWLARRRRGQQLPEIELDHAMPHAVEPDRMQADSPKKRTRRKARPRVSAPPAGT